MEILKALRRDRKALVLDEPTAVLTPPEVDDLFATLRRLRADGLSIILISHKLPEIRAIADRVTVLRAGHVTFTGALDELSDNELAVKMVGRELPEGNGQRELGQALVGVHPATGEIELDGTSMTDLQAAARVDAGIGYVPDDRRLEGLVPDLSIAENMVLKRHRKTPYATNGVLNLQEIQSLGARLLKEHDVRAPDASLPVSALSGGNQQKVILARELDRNPRLVVAINPTRGLDVGAALFVHEELRAVCEQGGAVLLISTDLDEILTYASRVAVMNGGRLTPVPDSERTPENIALRMAGAEQEAAS